MFSLPCGFTSSDPNKVLYHTLNCQWTQKNEKFGIRQKLFDKSVGTLMYRSIHFGILVSDIKSKIKNGLKCYINIQAKNLSFKRSSQEKKP